MAVASLGSLFTTVAGLSIGQGILTGLTFFFIFLIPNNNPLLIITMIKPTAIDTLVAQAFTGASNPHTVGTILQRGLMIMYIFGAFVAILW
jgi:MATE family multidrug resistance protein